MGRTSGWRYDPRKWFFEDLAGWQQDGPQKKKIELIWKSHLSAFTKIEKDLALRGVAGAVAGLAEYAYMGAHTFGFAREATVVRQTVKDPYNPALYQAKAFKVHSTSSSTPATGQIPTDTIAGQTWTALVEWDLENAEDLEFPAMLAAAESIGAALSGGHATGLRKALNDVAAADLANNAEVAVGAKTGPAIFAELVANLATENQPPPYALIIDPADHLDLMQETGADGIAWDSRIRPNADNGYLGYATNYATHVYQMRAIDPNTETAIVKAACFSINRTCSGIIREVSLSPYSRKGAVGLQGSLRVATGPVFKAGTANPNAAVSRTDGAM